MSSTSWKSGFAALVFLAAGLVSSAPATVQAGSVTFQIDGGNTFSLTPHLSYDSATLVDVGFGVPDGDYGVTGGRIELSNLFLGKITFSATGPVPFSIAGVVTSLTPTGLTSGYGEIVLEGPPAVTQFTRFSYDLEFNRYLQPSGGTFTLATVPEPSTFAMAGTALVGLGVAARRRKAAVRA